MENKQSQRETAYKTTIQNITKGSYVKQEGWNPNYVLAENGMKLSRVQLIGVVVSKIENEGINHTSITIDDNTGNITIRSFEEKNPFASVEIGDVVLIIGRPREYNDSLYIVYEGVNKKINPKWAELWKKEIGKYEPVKEEKEIEIKEVEETEEIMIGEDANKEKVIKYIRNNDSGKGVEIQKIIDETKIEGGEEKITNMLKKGELFEIKKGIVKILE